MRGVRKGEEEQMNATHTFTMMHLSCRSFAAVIQHVLDIQHERCASSFTEHSAPSTLARSPYLCHRLVL